MKKYYNLVVSVLDVNGNRVDAQDITGSSNKKEILVARENLDKEIEAGKYDNLKRENCTLDADIEVHNDDTWELLYIM
jgi:hypothetical protein